MNVDTGASDVRSPVACSVVMSWAGWNSFVMAWLRRGLPIKLLELRNQRSNLLLRRRSNAMCRTGLLIVRLHHLFENFHRHRAPQNRRALAKLDRGHRVQAIRSGSLRRLVIDRHHNLVVNLFDKRLEASEKIGA